MHIYKSAVIAAAVVAFASAPAIAETTVGLSAATSATTNGGIASSANVKSNANFGEVVSSIQAAKLGATQIHVLTTVKNVNVVKVSDVAMAENRTALDQEVTKNKDDIASLRSALKSNTAVKTALADASVNVDTVVAANISSDGMLTVYVL